MNKFEEMTKIFASIEGKDWTMEQLVVWMSLLGTAVQEFATYQQINGKSPEEVSLFMDFFRELDMLATTAIAAWRDLGFKEAPHVSVMEDFENRLNAMKINGVYPGDVTSLFGD